jgi:hypothetical protein
MKRDEGIEFVLSAFLIVENGSLVMGDPCYIPTEKERYSPEYNNEFMNTLMPAVDIPPGQYPVYGIVVSQNLVGMMILNTDNPQGSFSYGDFKSMLRDANDFLGLGVDSGTICMCTEETRLVWTSNDWDVVCEAELYDLPCVPKGKVIGVRIMNGVGYPISHIVVYGTRGDGTFPGIVSRDANGQLQGIIITTNVDVSEDVK